MGVTTVAVFIGSMRKESLSRKIAKAVIALSPQELRMEIVSMDDLLMYNQDLDDEGTPPASWTTFRQYVRKFDAVLFVTPEYNRSVPAVLKNALDVGSRPYGKNIWDGKPGAVVSVSPGRLSGFGANHHLRQSLVFLNIPVMQQPEAYIGEAAALFDDNGILSSESTRQFLAKFVDAFQLWVGRNSSRSRIGLI